MSEQFSQLVNEVKIDISEIEPAVVKEKVTAKQKFILIDVREKDEWLMGHIPGAIKVTKGVIERDIAYSFVAEKSIPLSLYKNPTSCWVFMLIRSSILIFIKCEGSLYYFGWIAFIVISSSLCPVTFIIVAVIFVSNNFCFVDTFF